MFLVLVAALCRSHVLRCWVGSHSCLTPYRKIHMSGLVFIFWFLLLWFLVPHMGVVHIWSCGLAWTPAAVASRVSVSRAQQGVIYESEHILQRWLTCVSLKGVPELVLTVSLHVYTNMLSRRMQDEQNSSDAGNIALLPQRAAAEGLRMVPQRFRPCQKTGSGWCVSCVPGHLQEDQCLCGAEAVLQGQDDTVECPSGPARGHHPHTAQSRKYHLTGKPFCEELFILPRSR